MSLPYTIESCRLWVAALLLAAPPFAWASDKPIVVVDEVFFTSRNHEENIDSTTVWRGSEGEQWLLSSAKSTHSILVEDALNGAFIKRVGGLGSQLGQFNRPNGVWVVDDLLFVVERDSRRVQVLALPRFSAIGTFGNERLVNPYGIYVQQMEKDLYHVYVTDNYEEADESVPANSELGRRVVVFEVEVEGDSDGTMDFDFMRYLGEVSGRGALRIVESIHGDSNNGNVLIAEEDTDHATSGFKVYGFEGEFKETILAEGELLGQAEGIALVPGEAKSGYWICADQGMRRNVFCVFDRQSLELVGAFEGRYTLNTDGIWFCPEILPRYPEGVFYAVHNDGNVAAFDWSEVKAALGLK